MKNQNDLFEEQTKEEPKNEKNLARGKAPRQKKKKIIVCTLLAIAIAVGCFFAGFFAYSLCLDEEMRTLIRVKNKIQKEYYQEVSDEAFYGAVFSAIDEAKAQGKCTSEEEFYKLIKI